MIKLTAWARVPPGCGVMLNELGEAKLRIWIAEFATVLRKITSPTSCVEPMLCPTLDGAPDAVRNSINIPPGNAGPEFIQRLICAGSSTLMCQVTRYVPTDGSMNSVLLDWLGPGLLITIPPTAGAEARGKLRAEPDATLGPGAEI